MPPITLALLQPVTIGSRAYVLRNLCRQDKVDLKSSTPSASDLEILRDLGFLTAWSQLRSSGREGSATIDELSAFAEKRRWRDSVGDHAEHYKRQHGATGNVFEAYDDGAFRQ
jgi:hypothetical protein